MNHVQRNRLLIFLATLLFVGVGTFFMIRFAKGYRPTRTGTIKGTGLLAATSFPTGAEVYINHKLTTATDNTLNLDPGSYFIEIKKDGYHSWSKDLMIEEELVTQTSATLFPTSPSLDPLTYTGAINPIPSPDGNKVVFSVASASAAAKNGLYVQDLTASPISLSRSARQIARSTTNFDYTTALYTWSPNGDEILVALDPNQNGEYDSHLILNSNRFNDLASLTDVSATLPQTLREWELELAREQETRLKEIPEYLLNLSADSSISNLYFSPDGKRLLYQATSDLTLPDQILPSLPASSTQSQTRTLTPNAWYVYDLEEDRNFLLAQGSDLYPEPILTNSNESTDSATFQPSKLLLLDPNDTLPPAELASSPSAFRRLQDKFSTTESITLFNAQYSPIFVTGVQWFPDSSHLILTSTSSIEIIEYDGTNRVTIYDGPFDHSFVYSWPDASRLVTRIQFSPDTTPNLYTIKLK